MEEELEFDRLVAEKRYENLIKALQDLSNQQKDEDFSELSKSLEKIAETNSKLFRSLIESLNNINNKETTDIITVEKTIENLTTSISTMINLIKTEYQNKKEWKFTITRNNNSIDTITAKQIK